MIADLTHGEPGTLRLRYHADGIEVLQADPVVQIDDLFLDALAQIDRDCKLGRAHFNGVRMGDGILSIEGVNRTVSYGIGRPGRLPMTRMCYLSNSPADAQ